MALSLSPVAEGINFIDHNRTDYAGHLSILSRTSAAIVSSLCRSTQLLLLLLLLLLSVEERLVRLYRTEIAAATVLSFFLSSILSFYPSLSLFLAFT